ncbi:hypothetical protein EB796_012353 [Bugula neritina]|uniref:Uncharacterized protein n=1 Tax=Bugula neritina TaxID=10212 RepID=A0A7J7JVJ8_BUGNE|nr:hypothetical protein EB796_012353 [Bugula neritina]
MSTFINVLGFAMFMDVSYRYYVFSFVWWWLTTVPFIVTLFLTTVVVVIISPERAPCSRLRVTQSTSKQINLEIAKEIISPSTLLTECKQTEKHPKNKDAVVEKTSYAYNKKRIQYMAGMIERVFKDKPTRAAVDTTSYVYNKKRIQYMAGVVETMFKNPPAKSTEFDDELKLTKGMCITSRMRQNFMKG